MSAVVVARGLVVEYVSRQARFRALDDADLSVVPGEAIGIVGESGSGKSTLGLAVGRLLAPSAQRVSGELIVLDRPVFELSPTALRHLRRTELAFIFQNPMSALDPTMTIGRQLDIILRDGPDRAGGVDPIPHLARVGLKDPSRVALSYPHQLSGGMAQRAAIAMALVHRPKVIVADEPTASLDTSVRSHVLDLLFGLAREIGAALLFLSHDLRSIAHRCERVAVMYGGRIVEIGPAQKVFSRPTHPYTAALLSARPGGEGPGGVIRAIPGLPPILHTASPGCAFADRCSWVIERCRMERPSPGHLDERVMLCHRAPEVFVAHHAQSEATFFAAQATGASVRG